MQNVTVAYSTGAGCHKKFSERTSYSYAYKNCCLCIYIPTFSVIFIVHHCFYLMYLYRVSIAGVVVCLSVCLYDRMQLFISSSMFMLSAHVEAEIK